jgi:hypothetical protein
VKLLHVTVDIFLRRLGRPEGDYVDPSADVVLGEDDAAVRTLPTGRMN